MHVQKRSPSIRFRLAVAGALFLAMLGAGVMS
jgi:hypothetical protein